MLSSDKRGIVCDRCGISVSNEFTYYSLDAKEVSVVNNSMTISTPIIHSFDICQRCMDEIKDAIIKNYKPYRIIDNRSCPSGIFCDLSGQHMNGNFICYHICISIVAVNVSITPSVVVKDDKYLELWVGASAFTELKDRALKIQSNKENKQWSATTPTG